MDESISHRSFGRKLGGFGAPDHTPTKALWDGRLVSEGRVLILGGRAPHVFAWTKKAWNDANANNPLIVSHGFIHNIWG